MIRCRATDHCEGLAQSRSYPHAPLPQPAAWEWYKPSVEELTAPGASAETVRHALSGGLWLRERTSRPALPSKR
jgi:hypothetical protein